MWDKDSYDKDQALAVEAPKPEKTNRSYAKEHAAFCRQVIFSEAYRRSIENRIADGSLPPGIEALLHYYAVGKPTERVKVTKRIETDLSKLSNEELAARAAQLARAAIEMKALKPANDEEKTGTTD